jgi:integrase
MGDRAAVLTWLRAAAKGAKAIAEEADRGPLFGELARRWWDGVATGSIGKRKRAGAAGYSRTTLTGYERTLRKRIVPGFGGRHAAELTEVDWQLWVDRLSEEGLLRSRIANLVSVVSAIYGWASRPTRRLVPGKSDPRDRAPAKRREAAQARRTARGGRAVARGSGARGPSAVRACLLRGSAARGDLGLRWEDVQLDGYRLHVRKAKSASGTNRRPPIAAPLRDVLRQAALTFPSETDDPVSPVSVMSGKLAARATASWSRAGLQRITLHECRHTYALFLMAAGYTLKELMEFMGHSDLQMVQRYTKLLPQPEESDPAERLDAYLGGRRHG